MKYVLRRCIQIIVVFVVSCALVISLSNRNQIINIISNNNSYRYDKDTCELYNWFLDDEDGNYVSKSDPQIIIYDVDDYLRDIRVNVHLPLGEINQDEIQVYYTLNEDPSFSADKTIPTLVNITSGSFDFTINKQVKDIRIDLVEEADVRMTFESVECNPRNFRMGKYDLLLCSVILLLFFVVFKSRFFIRKIYSEKDLIVLLAKNDLKSRYAGSAFGLIWAFVQPLMTILVFWIVYEVGFRAVPVENVKFIQWFVPAYISWIFFADAVANASNCLREYSYLVKKMRFPIEILPIIKVLASFVVHLFFVVLMFVIYIFYGYSFSLMNIQLLYYSFALICLLFGVAWLTSALSVFLKDFTQIISIILQLGFFMVPIFWNSADMGKNVVFFLKFNPCYYIVQGYRDTMLTGKFFGDEPWQTAYYWLVTVLLYFVGTKLFNGVRRHFADLL
ncbi:teichoic acid transport system permease protein [Lachnospiraceae bacterium]|nr:teichoic acid transport system permease protein [Lachnospiraceae bacterium]